MFERIIAALDMSETSKAVFARALSLAANNQAKLMLFHALSPEEENSPLPVPPDLTDMFPAAGNELTLEAWQQQWQEFEKQGLEMLQACASEAAEAGIQAEYQQILSSPGRAICKLAQEWQADLIVMGHRGRTGLSEIFLGSVSNYVLHHVTCSVLMVQPSTIKI